MPLAPTRRIERREHEVAVGLRGVRDPDLGPGQPVLGDIFLSGGCGQLRAVRAVSRGTRAECRRVGPGMWLGERERAEGFTGLHRRQPAASLLVGAPGHDRVLRQDVDRQADGRRHVDPAELLHDERPADVAEPGAADGLGEGRGSQAELAHASEDGPVEALGLVALDGARLDLALGELPGRRGEQALLVRERPGHALCPPSTLRML